ncbi:MAG: homoserine O-succinyltransferase [Oscillatoriales cyanobacterium RU_3_3]|nr:homoserine O-succinyltransferase [Oscillatoriales cyanobacterium RU_3_3]
MLSKIAIPSRFQPTFAMRRGFKPCRIVNLMPESIDTATPLQININLRSSFRKQGRSTSEKSLGRSTDRTFKFF